MTKKKYIFNPVTGRLNVTESVSDDIEQIQKEQRKTDTGIDKKVSALSNRIDILEKGQIVYAERIGVVSSDKVTYKLPISEYQKLNNAKKFFLSIKLPTVEHESYSSSSMQAGAEPVYIKIETSAAEVLVPLFVKQNEICYRRDIAEKENFIFLQFKDDMTGGEAYLVNGERAESTPASIYPANATVIENHTETININADSPENYVIIHGNGNYGFNFRTDFNEDKHVAIWLDQDNKMVYNITDDLGKTHTLYAGGYIDCFYNSQSHRWSFTTSESKIHYYEIKRFEEVRGALYNKQMEDRANFGGAFYPNGNAYTIIRWGDEASQVAMFLGGWGFATQDEVHTKYNIATRFFSCSASGSYSPSHNFYWDGENGHIALYADSSYVPTAPLGHLSPQMCGGKPVFWADHSQTRLSTINNGNARPLIDGGTDDVVVPAGYVGEEWYNQSTHVRKEYTAVYGTYNSLANPEAQGANVNFLCRVGESYSMYYQQKNYPLIHTNRKSVQIWGAEATFGTAYKSPSILMGYGDEIYTFSGYRASDGQFVQLAYASRICSPDYTSNEFLETPYNREDRYKSTSGWYSVQYGSPLGGNDHGYIRLLCDRKAGNTEYNAESSEPMASKGYPVFESNHMATHIRTINNGNFRPLIDGGTDVVSVKQGSDYSTKVEREYTALYGTYNPVANFQAKYANVNFFAKIGGDYCTYYQTANTPLIDATYAGVKFYKHQKQLDTQSYYNTAEIYLGGARVSGVNEWYQYNSTIGGYISIQNVTTDILGNFRGGHVHTTYDGSVSEYVNGFGDHGQSSGGNHNVFGCRYTRTLVQGVDVFIRGCAYTGSNYSGSVNIGQDNASYKEDINIGKTTDRSAPAGNQQRRRIFIGDDYAYLELYIKGKNFQTEVLDKIATLERQNSTLSSSLSSAHSALTEAQSNIATLQSDLAAALQRIANIENQLQTNNAPE